MKAAGPLLILLAAWAAATLHAAAAGVVGGKGIPSAPDDFRLSPLWSVPNLEPPRLNPRSEPVRAGVYLGWKQKNRIYPLQRKGHALVALDLRTGKEMWQFPGYFDRLAVTFAGDLALLRKNSRTLALSLASGKERWTSPACAFREHLHVTGETGWEIGAGLCREPVLLPVAKGPGPHLQFHHSKTQAVDLRTGAILWEFTAGPQVPVLGAGPGFLVVVMPADPGNPPNLRLRVLDPRLGTVRSDFPIRDEHAYWLHVSPRRPKQAVVLGHEITAVEMDSGRVLWRRERPMWWGDKLPRLPVVHEDRLLISCRDSIFEFDLRNGAPRGTYVLPDRLGTESLDPRLLPLQDGGLVVVAGKRNHPPMLARFAGPGAAPELSTIPASHFGIVSVREGILVLGNSRNRDWVLEAYGGFVPIPRRPPSSPGMEGRR